ncbi:MAG: ATP-binding protein [Gammaproteobacteria bacterium]|nr:ATP-binding protein [Gammaproteobacteria bacterium]
MHDEIAPQRLRPETDASTLSFETTEEIGDLDGILGQERATRAIHFGTHIQAEGYNLFAMGAPATEKRAVVEQLLAEAAEKRPAPNDWCYVYGFDSPSSPQALSVAAGQGRRLERAINQLIEDVRNVVPAVFHEEEYKTRSNEITKGFEERQKRDLEELQQEAEKHDMTLLQTPHGFAFAPLVDGKVLDNEQFQELPTDTRERISNVIEELTRQLVERMQDIPGRQQVLVRAQKDLVREMTEASVRLLVNTAREPFQAYPEITELLSAIQSDIVEHAQTILALESETPAAPQLFSRADPERFYDRYRINLIVDNADIDRAPIVYESNPTLENLVGRIEHRAEFGALISDFNLIRSGALHRSNGGFLIVETDRILTKPFAWEALKRALLDKEIRIESAGQLMSLGTPVSLDPQPIPIDVKVVLLGTRLHYYLLSQSDPDFTRLFKVPAEFVDRIERSDDNVVLYAQLIATLARREELLPLTREAVGAVIDQNIRSAGDSERLSTHIRNIIDLMREADFIARAADAARVEASHVTDAVHQQIDRLDRIRADVHEQILRGTIHIDISGEVIGQVNGLSVLQVGEFAFGQPSRITATARLGHGEVVDIEREARLAGKIHTKAMMIVASFIGHRYASEQPLSLQGSLVFEQSYGGIEGDSASVAEVCALLSAIARVPLKQSFSITGSMDQHGRVQAIGGANEKIEGFFDICSERGLTGDHGVIIPADNVKHLMLRADVVEAAAQGKFHVYAITTVDDAIRLLSGMEPGEPDEEGSYPEGTFNRAVTERLEQLTAIARKTREDESNGIKKPANEDEEDA